MTRGTESKRRWRGEGMGGIQLREGSAVLEAGPAPEGGVCEVGWADVIAALSGRSVGQGGRQLRWWWWW